VLKSNIQAQAQEQDDEFGLGLAAGYCRRLKLCQDNVPVIMKYLKALANEINVSDNYKRMNLTTLVYLSRFHSNKQFKEMTKDGIILYLNSLRKKDAADPLHDGYQLIICMWWF
jgi:AraC-like DNA-binding protein